MCPDGQIADPEQKLCIANPVAPRNEPDPVNFEYTEAPIPETNDKTIWNNKITFDST